jgi:UDP-galactopyranose mutase
MNILIVGAGFSGVVFGRMMAEAGHHITITDKRDHIGGNCHDGLNPDGVLTHTYGPHYFRTNSKEIVEFLSKFTDWQDANYKVLSKIEGTLWSFPINLRTFEQLTGQYETEESFKRFIACHKINIPSPKNSEEVIISQVGKELYEKFFEGYTMKQWGMHPRDLDPSVCGRIPIRTNRDDRYFDSEFQKLPSDGYTKLFERMLGYETIKLELGVETTADKINYNLYDLVVWTGAVDSFFNYQFGKLPYRSLRFRSETHDTTETGTVQSCVQYNYPSKPSDYSELYTRSVEVKHITKQKINKSTVVFEYPAEKGEPFYPIPAPHTRELADKYRKLADMQSKVLFLGRLATYRYVNMDQVIGAAMHEAKKLL